MATPPEVPVIEQPEHDPERAAEGEAEPVTSAGLEPVSEPVPAPTPEAAPVEQELPFDPPVPVVAPPAAAAPPEVPEPEPEPEPEPAVEAEPAPPPPPRVPTPAERARALAARGDFTAAIALLTEALERDGNDATLYAIRGAAFTALRRFPEAERDLARAHRLAEHDVEVLLAMGILRCRSGRWRDAVPFLEEAVRSAPDLVEAHYFLGEALNHVDQLHAALEAFDAVVRLAPDMWRAHQSRGVVLDRLARREEATEAYRQAREARTK